MAPKWSSIEALFGSVPASVHGVYNPPTCGRAAVTSVGTTTVTSRTGRPRGYRVGAVSYLNSKPLIEGLPELLPGSELILDYPSRLADDLAAGFLDVALIPSVELLRDADYEIVSDACVATHGPVLSVKLYSRVPPSDIRTLALDEGSRTSAALSRILLAERYGVEPELRPLPLESSTSECLADAILLIGDRAMHPPREEFAVTWDLGEEWLRWTGLPFVFALWAGRTTTEHEEPEFAELAELLGRARDLGIERLESIAQREAPKLGLTVPLAHSYLRDNLHFYLGSAELSGLRLFHGLARKVGAAPVAENTPRRAASGSLVPTA